MGFKEKLNELKGGLDEAIAEASKLTNQNLADILRSGAAKLDQAAQHADVDRVDDTDNSQHQFPYETNSGGSAASAAGDPGKAAQAQEAAKTAAYGKQPIPLDPVQWDNDAGLPVPEQTK